MSAVTDVAPLVGIVAACVMLAVARASYYRVARAARRADRVRRHRARSRSGERQARARRAARAALRGPRARRGLRDAARRGPLPLLGAHDVPHSRGESGGPRAARPAPARRTIRVPSCSRRRPNELWSWDITKLLGPAKWTYFYLYVILDVFSRYVVGWMVAHRGERGAREEAIDETCRRQGIEPGQLTLHADRGSSMTSKSVALLLADLGVTKTHSRPYVSNDNPFSESAFKTLKYRPDFPERFGCTSRTPAPTAGPFFDWYNHEHRHGALGLCTPYEVHHGLAAADARAPSHRPRRRLRRPS